MEYDERLLLSLYSHQPVYYLGDERFVVFIVVLLFITVDQIAVDDDLKNKTKNTFLPESIMIMSVDGLSRFLVYLIVNPLG